ncbi:MAG: HD domain-containing protein [Methanobrevibacter sp.]|jgi:hypothetical protein|nr:HD domain-containing protein [Candidatus Methanoflexus mossambicus]
MYSYVIKEMIKFFKNDKKRIAHSLKVFAYAQTLCELENLGFETSKIAILSAILHDVGIKIAEKKHNSSAGRYQELYGGEIAENILNDLNYDKNIIKNVKFNISNHHHPNASESIDFRILIESDYIVNFEEEDIPLKSLDQIIEKQFKTKSGKEIINTIFK